MSSDLARVRTAALVALGVTLTAGCGSSKPDDDVVPVGLTLPTAGIAGHKVTVYPLTLIADDPRLGWEDLVRPRAEALGHADSIIFDFLTQRAPEVTWIAPDELRRAARQAPGLLANPDQMATALLRAPSITQVPDPLRSQMRTLTGVAGDRYAMVPAALAYYSTFEGRARAELMVVLTDVRRGLVGFRTVAKGEGDDPWGALFEALTTLVVGLP